MSKLQTNLKQIVTTLNKYNDMIKQIIPEQYKELVYIETTGTQYLQNVTLSPNFKIEYDVVLTQTSEHYNFFDNNTSVPMLWLDESMQLEANATTPRYKVNSDTRYKIANDNISGNHVSVDGNVVITQSKISGGSWDVNLLNRNGTAPFKGKIYGIKIWDNTTLTLNLIPVVRNSDNKVCFYDLVSRKYFENKGAGEFISRWCKI